MNQSFFLLYDRYLKALSFRDKGTIGISLKGIDSGFVDDFLFHHPELVLFGGCLYFRECV